MTDRDMDAMEGKRAPFTYHGGDLDAARGAFPGAPTPWIDLSTGINPVAYPVVPIAIAAWTALPGFGAVTALEAAGAGAYGADAAGVVAAPGTEALIQWLPHLWPARRVGVLGFAYGDHAGAWGAAGASVTVTDDFDALAGHDVAVVVNPNNPDGRRVAPGDLTALAGRVGLLVVDEAFADVEPAASSLAPSPPRNAIVLRSFGKFYGLAGLRLGFAVARAELAARLRRALGPWAVSGPAIAIGTRALADTAWAEATRSRLVADAARLDALLMAHGAGIVGGTSLFRLVAVDDGARWFDHLAGAGVLTRPFVERPRWLRFGLPAGEPQWDRLERALSRTGRGGSPRRRWAGSD